MPLRIASGPTRLARARADVTVAALARAPEPVPASVVTVEPASGRGAAPDEGQGCSDLVRAARRALLDGRADACVHSLSDVPVEPVAAVVLCAVLPRADARDALVASAGRRLADLPAGARVGADSPRGASMLRAVRPDLATAETACGVDAAVGLVARGRYDAVLTARRGRPERRRGGGAAP
ncbi:MAG: hydroxymethylbilane synthase, partial [Chloroflexi bacterium]|nr:hydroxymethylbilane synthase [Chloroflexota bacterium]